MMNFKAFDLYDLSEVGVKDPSLKRVINLDSKLVLKSHGRIKYDPAKAKVNVIERLIILCDKQITGNDVKAFAGPVF